jgi:hypothetical protein
MPVILDPGSDEMRTWLDPARHEWSRDLQSLLKPFRAELDIYAVSNDVGKVGNDSPSFVVPLDSAENKSNIANFFKNATKSPESSKPTASSEASASTSSQMSVEFSEKIGTTKRKAPSVESVASPATKKTRQNVSAPSSTNLGSISSTSNSDAVGNRSDQAMKGNSKRITSFFRPVS